jgi:AcrR family transcriptional regulator
VRHRDQAKERAILAGALAVVGKEGLAGLSMDGVARAAKVAIGTVYIYFASKEALLNALYLSCKREFSTLVFGAAGPREPIKPAFFILCAEYLGYVAGHRAELVFMHQFQNSPFLFAETKKEVTGTLAPLVKLLERGRNEGLFKPLPTPAMIAFLQGTLGELAAWAEGQPKKSRVALYGEFAQLCWDGLSN